MPVLSLAEQKNTLRWEMNGRRWPRSTMDSPGSESSCSRWQRYMRCAGEGNEVRVVLRDRHQGSCPSGSVQTTTGIQVQAHKPSPLGQLLMYKVRQYAAFSGSSCVPSSKTILLVQRPGRIHSQWMPWFCTAHTEQDKAACGLDVTAHNADRKSAGHRL
jgi:hypothetical protein